MHFYCVVALFAEHVNHFAHKVLRFFGWPLCDFHYCLLSGLAALKFLFGDEDVVIEDVALGV